MLGQENIARDSACSNSLPGRPNREAVHCHSSGLVGPPHIDEFHFVKSIDYRSSRYIGLNARASDPRGEMLSVDRKADMR